MGKILIVNPHFNIGGVETFLLRLIALLNKRDYEISVLLLSRSYDKNLFNILKNIARVHCLTEILPLTKTSITSVLGEQFDIIFCTMSHSLVLGAYLIGNKIYPTAHLCCGIYQTEIFCRQFTWKSPNINRLLIHHLFSKCVPHQNKLFGNEAGRSFHQLKLQTEFTDSNVATLIVDVEKYFPPTRDIIDPYKIVSIGRICDFKTYNFTMLPALKHLNNLGLFFHYYIYGDGNLRGLLEARIREYGLTDQVFLCGEIPYTNFKSIVSSAFVFVGSGTSLIEAAACGVPSLTTIEYCNVPETYGFIDEVPGTSLIEPDLPYPRHLIADKIAWLKQISSHEYESVANRGLQKILCYSERAVADNYIKYFSNTVALQKALPLIFIKLYVLLFVMFNFIRNSIVYFNHLLKKRQH